MPRFDEISLQKTLREQEQVHIAAFGSEAFDTVDRTIDVAKDLGGLAGADSHETRSYSGQTNWQMRIAPKKAVTPMMTPVMTLCREAQLFCCGAFAAVARASRAIAAVP
jgi:hypothetical protein